MRKKWIMVLSGLGFALLICLFAAPLRARVSTAVLILSSMDVGAAAAYIRSFGPYAAAASFLLMIFQSLAAPLPAFLITFANAAIFGWWRGALLSWSSAMAGAVLCFRLARWLGRDAVARLTSRGALKQVDAYFEKYGAHTILICRLLPFVSFDAVSYAAGLTAMSFRSFFIATGLGQLPATLIYSYVGAMLSGGAKMAVTALLILFSLTIFIFMLKSIHKRKRAAHEKI